MIELLMKGGGSVIILPNHSTYKISCVFKRMDGQVVPDKTRYNINTLDGLIECLQSMRETE
jgi:hypothetical protein